MEVTDKGAAVDHAGHEAQVVPVEGKVGADQVLLNPAEGERQPWWPEGVNSEAELRTYVEGLGKDKPDALTEAGDKVDTTATPKATPIPTDDEIKANLQKAGGIYADPRYEPFALEFEKTGALADESVAKAAAAFGVPANAVKDFIAGQLAQRQMATSTATQAATAKDVAAAGVVNGIFKDPTGPNSYAEFHKWGSANLSQAEQDAYNGAIDRSDTVTMKALLGQFQQRYQEGGNAERREVTVQGKGGGSPPGDAGETKPFGSLEEGRRAMASRRYGEDPAYRATVDKRYIIT